MAAKGGTTDDHPYWNRQAMGDRAKLSGVAADSATIQRIQGSQIHFGDTAEDPRSLDAWRRVSRAPGYGSAIRYDLGGR